MEDNYWGIENYFEITCKWDFKCGNSNNFYNISETDNRLKHFYHKIYEILISIVALLFMYVVVRLT